MIGRITGQLSRNPFEEDFTEDRPVSTGGVQVESKFAKGAKGGGQRTFRQAKLVKTAHRLELLLTWGCRHYLELFFSHSKYRTLDATKRCLTSTVVLKNLSLGCSALPDTSRKLVNATAGSKLIVILSPAWSLDENIL